MALTASKIKHMTGPGKHADGIATGLYLFIGKNGSKSWVLRAMVHGKRREVGLGSFPAVSLKEARRRAVERRHRIEDGESPLRAPRAPVPTYAEAATAYRDLNAGRWSASHAKLWFTRQQKYAFPACGDVPINRVGRTDDLAARLSNR